jgi:hypothetical protein
MEIELIIFKGCLCTDPLTVLELCGVVLSLVMSIFR